jgi:mRNA interferase MazF
MRRGEVWAVNLDPTVGAEIRKIRPCVIVSRDALARLPLKIIVPLTEWDDRYASAPWHVRVEVTMQNGLSKQSSADTYQVRSISESRLIRRLGELSNHVMGEINKGLALSLAID